MDSSHSILHADEVSRAYGDGPMTWALRGGDFRVEPGEFVAIVGASGSGKSPLLNLIGALDRPTGGRIYIDGKDTSRLNDDALAVLRGRTIGFIFQFHHLLSEFTLLENALVPLWISDGRAAPEDVRWVRELFCRVGLEDRMDSRPTQISGGEQQRAAIVRALARRPKLILADEPTGNLDTRNGTMVLQLLTEIREQFGIAFALVTHDERFANKAQRIVAMEDGRIVADYQPGCVEEEARSAAGLAS